MGEHSTETRLFNWMVHTSDNQNAFLSEGGALAVVVGDVHETPHQTRDNTDFPRLMRPSEARLRLAGPPPARISGAPPERGAGGGSAPRFLAADAPRGRDRLFMPVFVLFPAPGGRSHHRDPFGKAQMRIWSQVIAVNLTLTAVGLRVRLPPWRVRGEVALLDLVRATDPFMYTLSAGSAELEQELRGMS